ncbi:MAG: hypothetical protein V2J16_12390 [Thermoleophilia bacterium]|nr:hypothetical protein [Thermoleophilia bacterium]
MRDHLIAWAGADDLQAQAFSDPMELSATAAPRRGSFTWSRDELHEHEATDRIAPDS